MAHRARLFLSNFGYTSVGIPCLLMLFLGSLANASVMLRADISAKSAILMNEETGAILYAKNANAPQYPASITKIVTALYALEKQGGGLDELIVASAEAIAAVPPHIRRTFNRSNPPYRLEFGGSHMGIKVGEVLSFRTLMYGLMLASGNDAANVIAQHVSKNVTQFMEELNQFVRSKGCVDTVFHTPHGLPHPEHKTTAYEMAKLTQLALQNPFFREVVKTVKYPRPQTNKQPESELIQHNALLRPGRFYYPKAIGVKTGYTTSGGYTLVAAAEDENRKLILVLLGCEQIQQRYRDAITLFETAFAEKKMSRTLFARGFDHFSCVVPGGIKPLEAELASDLILEYYPSEEEPFTTRICWDAPILPILAGSRVGEVQVVADNGKLLLQSPLYARGDVDSCLSYKFQQKWTAFKGVLRRNIPWVMTGIGFCMVGWTFYAFHHRGRKRASKRRRN